MINLVIGLIFGLTDPANAGSSWAKTTVSSIQYRSNGDLLVELSSLPQDGLMSALPSNIKKLRLRFLKWPPDSRNSSVFNWITGKSSELERNGRDAFEKCSNHFIQSLILKSPITIGQTGGGKFEFTDTNVDEVFVPYFDVTFDNEKNDLVCLINLG